MFISDSIDVPQQKTFLEARKERLNLEENVNKRKELPDGDISRHGGFFCNLCDCLLKDSASWLDHLNGRSRILFFNIDLKKMGTSVKVKDSSLADVLNSLINRSRKDLTC